MQPSFSDEGIVIKILEYGEADKIIWILTRQHGYLELIAKGARRPTSKKSAHLDLINKLKIQVARGEHPQRLIQAEVGQSYPHIKSNLHSAEVCLFLAEIINFLAPPDQTDIALYQSLSQFLKAINHPNQPTSLLLLSTQFHLYLLRHYGYPVPDDISTKSLVHHTENIIGRKLVSGHFSLV